ncbi:MAG: CAP domain-containing protein [Campylobacterota bacterium]|nr:CAP domain-containing protein [Campylobacterota bacterium]
MRIVFWLLVYSLLLYGDTLNYLNELRIKSGLIALSNSEVLKQGAYNHARYLDKYDEVGHDENPSKLYSTGRTMNDRATYVGYKGSVLENISISADAKSSIDDLFGAIYHRFGFLNLHIDEIGLAEYYKDRKGGLGSYVYKMGNSKMQKLCSGKSYQGYGKIYTGACSEPSFKINGNSFREAHYFNARKNPSIVLFPYRDARDIPTTFYEEIPDPLPHCSVSGYPVSIEFNANDFKSVELVSFELFDKHYENVEAKRILTQESDPNHKLTALQFAFMPLEPLDFDSTYHAKVRYILNNEEQSQEWSFRTYKPKHTLLKLNKSKQRFNISSAEEYLIYIKPKDCNDKHSTINSTYPQGMEIEHRFINSNMLYFKIEGKVGESVKCRLDGGRKFTLRIR